jgi:exodeoxyribonuclease III
MWRITTLNLNGIRSAVAKGLPDWVAATAPDLLCVQELKAQAADMAGRYNTLAGLRGYFHFAKKKGYSGVGIYTRHEPSDVITGIGVPAFDDEGRWIELRFDTPARRLSVVSVYFPSGSSGEERQQAKFRFLEQVAPVLARLAQGREALVCGDINIAHTERDLKNWRSNQKKQRLFARGARLDDPAAGQRRLGGRVPPPVPRRRRRGLHLVEPPRPSLGQQRGLAHRLPVGHAGAGRARAQRAGV